MTTQPKKNLEAAVKKFCGMRYPSVEKLLRGRGFKVEADACKSLVDVFDACGGAVLPQNLHSQGAGYFLIIVSDDKQPLQLGPFISADEQTTQAIKHYRRDVKKKHLILWLDVFSDVDVEVGSYDSSVFK